MNQPFNCMHYKMYYLISQLKSCFSHCNLHLFQCDEPVPLRWLTRTTITRPLQCGQQTIHFLSVVLNELHWCTELCPVLYCYCTLRVSRDHVVVLLTL